MKNVVIIISTSLIVCVLALIVYFILDKKQEKWTTDVPENIEVIKEKQENIEKTEDAEVITVSIQEVMGDAPSNEKIHEVMHHMSHQKVRADTKWGAIPLVKSTVDEVYEMVSTSDYHDKAQFITDFRKVESERFSHD